MAQEQEKKDTGFAEDMLLMEMATAYRHSLALQAAAMLGIADILHEAPASPGALAKATNTNAGALERLLRALASKGIFRENEEGLYENTALSDRLRSHELGSVRDSVIYIPNEGSVRAWMSFMEALKTEKPSYNDANGFTSWEYRQNNPVMGEHFNKHMAFSTSMLNETFTVDHDFSGFNSIIDVGGGHGALLTIILKKHPHIKGALLEIPYVAAQATNYLAESGFSDRVDVIAGSFFETVPPGHDAYLLKWVLHNWSDEEALAILKNCRKAIPAHGKLLIFEKVIKPGNEEDESKWIDLHMMVNLGGKKRSLKEFEALLASAGFALTNVSYSPSDDIIEASPV